MDRTDDSFGRCTAVTRKGRFCARHASHVVLFAKYDQMGFRPLNPKDRRLSCLQHTTTYFLGQASFPIPANWLGPKSLGLDVFVEQVAAGRCALDTGRDWCVTHDEAATMAHHFANSPAMQSPDYAANH